jgi:L-asparaginase / beta-aspartyl-peptidase
MLTRAIWIALALVIAPAVQAQESGMMDKGWSIAVHGGAGTMSREAMTGERQAEYEAALAGAIEAGAAVLEAGGSALDAVEAAVTLLEDDPKFNAGRGAVFAYSGVNELDASIMDGRDRSAGAVTGVTHVRNPIRLARAVMEDSPHVFLSREGAEEFARERSFEMVDPDWFATPERWRQLEELKARQPAPGKGESAWFDVDLKYGTVGAVAVDREGHVAAATSTGGLTGKRWGRIGDSPVIGAGNYADDRACAVSATGAGEFFIRAGVAHEICARMRLLGESAQDAADAVIAEVGALGGDGGVIVAAPDGSTAFSFNTPGMYRARADSAGLREVAIFAED